jgi:hypothetical protein
MFAISQRTLIPPLESTALPRYTGDAAGERKAVWGEWEATVFLSVKINNWCTKQEIKQGLHTGVGEDYKKEDSSSEIEVVLLPHS